MGQILLQDGAVKRADGLNIQIGRFLQYRLHLSAVFSYDSDVVAAGFIIPGLFHIQCAEFSEGVGGKQNLFRAFIGEHDLRPVNHGCADKVKNMAAQ